MIYSNYKICDWRGASCSDLNMYTWVNNIEMGGNFYYSGRDSASSDSAGLPIYGNGPFQDPGPAY